jgi:ribose-phosphate pyrophosphokinase
MMQNGYLTQNTEKRLMIVSGQGYPELSERIAERLDMELAGVELIEFPGGELYARWPSSRGTPTRARIGRPSRASP